ncbi:MAG: transporter substrate-binding domain-containing protein [Candidatus Rokubacteria bacterium]|nr:transporter substrate-binding domain-containing protein [Candidatus Rokubacteria bacterium]
MAWVIGAAMLVLWVDAASAQQSALDTVKKRGVLIAGARADLFPLAYMNAKGEFDGFDIDIYKILAQRLGVKLELRQATSQTMIPMLQSGAIDIGPTATSSKKREEAVDFTVVAFWDAGKVLVQKGSPIKRLQDLKGKTIGIVHGSYYGITLKEMFPSEKFVTYPEYPQALAALEAGKVDATPLTWSNTLTILKERPAIVALEDDILKDPMAFPLRENDSKWRKWVNTTLQELWKAGTYQQIYKKHFGRDVNFSLWSPYGLQPGI